MARSVDDAALLLRAMSGADRAMSGASDLVAPLVPADLSSVRVAFSADLGGAAMSNAYRDLFAARTALFRHHFASTEDHAPDLGSIDHTFEVLRGVSYVADYGDIVSAHRDDLSPNVIDNVERGQAFSIADVAAAYRQQAQLVDNWTSFFDDVDVLICPAAALTPFAHSTWWPTEIDGVEMDSYMRWLGIVYGPTMALACGAALPCGLDHVGMPFGIQVLSRRGNDIKVLEIAKSIETVLAGNALTARPVPDLAKLGVIR